MERKDFEHSITRRQVITGTATALAGLVAGAGVSAAQPKGGEPLVTKEELVSWTTDFSQGLNEGKSLIACLSSASGKQRNQYFREALSTIEELLGKGYTLSKVMALHSSIFDERYVTTVRFGELYGELDSALKKWIDSQR